MTDRRRNIVISEAPKTGVTILDMTKFGEDFDTLYKELCDVYESALAKDQIDNPGTLACFQHFVEILERLKETTEYIDNKDHWDSEICQQREYVHERIAELKGSLVENLKSDLQKRNQNGQAETNARFEDNQESDFDDFSDESCADRETMSPKMETVRPKSRSSKRSAVTECEPTVTTSKPVAKQGASQANTIVVEVDEEFEEEDLEMYFESRKGGHGDVTSITRDNKNDHRFLITFTKNEDVERILGMKHRLKGKSLEVTLKPTTDVDNSDDNDSIDGDEGDDDDDDESGFVLKVEGVPEGKTEEDLSLYFENKRRGGRTVERVEVDEDCCTALVYFEEEDAVRTVLQKGPFSLDKKRLMVSEYLPSQTYSSKSWLASVKTKTVIRVDNLCDDMEMMENYFENKKRSGACVKEIKQITDDDAMYLVYETETEAAEVAKRCHTLRRQKLNLTLHNPPSATSKYPNRFFITGIKDSTAKKELETFLFRKMGYKPVKIEYGTEVGTALVTVQKSTIPIDWKKLRKTSRRRPLEGCFLEFVDVPISKSIIVRNAKGTDADTISLYFESKRSGNIDEVESEIVDETENEGEFLVRFSHHSVVDSILEKKHKLKNNVLDVSLYVECLGPEGGQNEPSWFRLPKPFQVDKINIYKGMFLRENKEAMAVLEEKLSSVHTAFEWQSDRSITFNCTLDENEANARRLVRTWKKDTEDLFEKLLSRIFSKCFNALKETWGDVTTELAPLKHDDDEAIYQIEDHSLICVLGLRNSVDQLASRVEQKIQEVEDDKERKKKEIKETLDNIKPLSLKYLVALGFQDTVMTRFSTLQVEVDLSSNIISFTGQLTDVKYAQTEMFKILNSDSKMNPPNFNKPELKFLQSNSVERFLLAKMKDLGLVGAWIVEDGAVTFQSRTDKEAKAVVDLVENSIQVKFQDIDPDLLSSREWTKFSRNIENDNADCISIYVVKDHQVAVLGTDDVFDAALEEVKNFLEENTVFKKELKLKKGVRRFIDAQCQAKLSKIAQTYREYRSCITCNKDTITVKATANGLRNVVREVEKIELTIKQDEKSFDHPGVVKLLASEKGKQVINSVESTERCIIERDIETDAEDEEETEEEQDDLSEESGPKKLAECEATSHVTVSIWKGDITELSVNAIVNAANKKLEHAGGLAKVLVDRGGWSIQEESRRYVKNNGHVMVGEIAVTGAGALACHKIIHAVGPVWNGGNDNEEEDLKEACLNCLDKAEELSFTSLAIPAISTGIYGFPAPKATRISVAAIADHLRESQSSSLTEVYICDNNETTAQAFIDAAKKAFGRPRVKMVIGQSTRSTSRNSEKNSSRRTSRISTRVEVGEIATQRADVIVSTTSASLDLTKGAVSNSILKAGGRGLQDECKRDYPGGIQPGDFAVTGGGNLDCTKVFHSNLPCRASDPDKRILRELVQECLTETSNLGLRSIVFPALGTGKLGYASDEVAQIMFATVQGFGETNPRTSIETVTFVLNSTDTSNMQAFRTEEIRLQSNPTSSSKREPRSRRSTKPVVQDQFQFRGTSDDAMSTFNIGNIELTIKSGDLTKENVDCIVNSTNDSLDLRQGAVSKAIASAGGAALMSEINTKRDEMKNNGLVTTSARGLKAASIIHISASMLKDWRQVFLACLNEVERRNMKAIAFPLFGTGVGSVKPDEMGEILVDSLVEYEKKSKQPVEDVRMVIFQREMMIPVVNAVKKTGTAAPSLPKRFMNFISGGAGKPSFSEVRDPEKRQPTYVKLYFFSDDQTHIDNAVDKIQSRCNDTFTEHPMIEDSLKNLNVTKTEQLEGLAATYGVKVNYQKRTGRIRLHGHPDDVLAANNAVHKIILGSYIAVKEKEKAAMMSSIVQWHFVEICTSGDSRVTKYDDELNQNIEEAYQNQKKEYEFYDDQQNLYILDFDTMEEFPENDDTDRVQVIRKDLMKGYSTEEVLPSNWSKMTSECEMVLVPRGSSEFQEVEDSFMRSVGGSFKVIKTVWAKKQQMATQNPGIENEKILWHGTEINAVTSIYKNGFNRSYCGKNAVVYGEGVYFAANASYSAQNTYSRPDTQGNKLMFRAKVLTGMFTQGTKGIRVPPTRDSTNHILYDSVVDAKKPPTIFVIFNDTQAYPEYLITFN